MRLLSHLLLLAALTAFSISASAQDSDTVAVIGTGDMGDSLGPKLSGLGYRIVYGSRDPERKSVQELVDRTGNGASATSQEAAAQAADIVLLAVPWPPMEHVAQNLGNLSGKIVIDVSFPYRQAEDGYPELMVPLYQRRSEGWEFLIRRSSYWPCRWQDDWSVPVEDSSSLAQFPEPENPPKPCSEYPDRQ